MEPRASVKNLIPYVPGKPIEELERELGIRSAAKLASNENPLGPSPLAQKALSENLSTVNLYPDGGCFELRRKLSRKLRVPEDMLIIGNGSNEVIEIVARTFLEPGDEAIYGSHAFIVYPIVTQSLGCSHVVSRMPDLTHDLEDMSSLITEKTRIIYIANPNNPTGTIVRREEFEWFLRQVPENIIILVDEAYFEYVDDPEYPDTLRYHTLRESLVTVRTFSKIYGLAGLRVGYAVASREAVSYMDRVRQPFNVNSAAQAAACAALDDEEHVARSIELNRTGREYFRLALGNLGLGYTESYANFFLVDIGRDPAAVYEALLRDGVITRPVGGYGLKTHLRVSFGLPGENERFIESLRRILGK
ncbi:MAG: histidinol-phosphate transaminase [Candidatus Dadabacteria bacterium]|nr:histidinol-phosphate transaminase [Candidatus Dadabacteria bacterium]MCY4263051.1 histidinol-phosphate transaminase [Candidatus Dadabacteria bacterium]